MIKWIAKRFINGLIALSLVLFSIGLLVGGFLGTAYCLLRYPYVTIPVIVVGLILVAGGEEFL